MNLGNIRCLDTKGGMLPDNAFLLLDEVAVRLLEAGKPRLRILFEDAEVNVATQFRYRLLGSFCGIKFDAQLDIQDKTYRVTYLANPKISSLPRDFVNLGSIREEELFSLN